MMDGGLDPWKVLGLEPGASLAEARVAWRAMALRHHPDRGGEPAAFIAAKEAWRQLQHAAPASVRGDDRRAKTRPRSGDPWTHARAVRYLVERVEADVETLDDGTTGLAASELVWLSKAGLEWEDFVVPWDSVDDQIMDDLVELLERGEGA